MTSNRALKAIALLVAGAGLAYGGYRAGVHHDESAPLSTLAPVAPSAAPV